MSIQLFALSSFLFQFYQVYMQKKNNQLILSPSGLGSNIKPGLFSKHCELNKLNKQKSFKIEETLTPKLFETKESSFAPQPKLQKSQSASRLLLPKEQKQERADRQEIQKIPSIKQDQITELSQKLYRELIEFNEQADFGGQNEIQQWSEEMIKKLQIIKNSLEQSDVFDNQDNVTEVQQQLL
ncbi:unnamed protein product (macronuclear) [Paramecium tetraurelia]|uniref:Uncharacterized protein n=1 Tax=Paramecium tetraurelia TaxID=5888 RepID=A0BAS2_PARTE|nr:uncharacterized protein GSPATT00000074001 [Paramecium tetraurelia]CAK55639.1 unnamed protein product [Paramecium tetraurelia]|eukprot:XP_001423037.1 hypothetical protein (macronuclear) [Paramecium tetraurelia strain d4-2]